MTDGVYPRCGSREIYTDGNLLRKINVFGLNQVVAKQGPFVYTLAEYENFLCAQCGYLERYVTNTSERQKLTKAWARVESVPKSS